MRRAKSQFDRSRPRYEPQPRVLILCEDTKSGLRYLQAAALHFRAHAEVDISHCGKNDPLSIVVEAIRRKSRFDKVYCAIDRDSHEKFDEALALALTTNKAVEVVASYPCYEFWLLLHFRKTRKPFVGVGNNSAADLVIKDLCREAGMNEYAKGGSDKLFEVLLDRLPAARKHAVEVLAAAVAEQSENPSTHLHELMDLFERLSNPKPIVGGD